jgi:hypothetical protein
MSGDDFEVSTGLPDNPCGEEAHQMVLDQSENREQARATTYMSGFFDAEGCIHANPSTRDDRPLGAEFRNTVSVELATSQMAGVFDGEGCIRHVVSESKGCSLGFKSYPGVRMEQNKEGTILEEIFETYCSHHGVDYKIYDLEARGHKSPAVSAHVHKSHNIRNFLTPLLPVLYEKQRQAAIMLREILPRYEEGVHLTKSGFIEMMKWKRELDRAKPMGKEDRKYTVEYFQNLWADDLEAQQSLDEFGGQSEVSADD